jgi:hypothetical protein
MANLSALVLGTTVISTCINMPFCCGNNSTLFTKSSRIATGYTLYFCKYSDAQFPVFDFQTHNPKALCHSQDDPLVVLA